MKQINFRLSEQEYNIAEELAKLLGTSVPALLKEMGLKELNEVRVNLALDMYRKHKVGLKRAWKVSGLPFLEFLHVLSEHKIEPDIPEELEEHMIATALELNLDDIFSGKTADDLRKVLYGTDEPVGD
jgi:predicted HTH domain antitoxin